LAILQEFFPPYLTYTPELPPEFTGAFSLQFDPNLRYTAKSQHLKDVTLTGDNDAGLIGNDWDNIFTGNAGDNMLRGNGGKDFLDGRDGTDTAVYASNVADYEVVRDGDMVKVIDKRVARDGADVLLNVERIAFADQVIDLSMGG
jgi:Ca2+-binding RTX toxin-like protein